MTNEYAKLVKTAVDLEGYSSSAGWVGYMERIGSFDEALCYKAIDWFLDLFGLEVVLVASYHMSCDFGYVRKTYGYSRKKFDEYYDKYIKYLIDAGAIKLVDYNQLEDGFDDDDYASPEYESIFDGIMNDFSVLESPSESVIRKALFCQMAVDGVRGHCFAVYPKQELIAYPHDDTGFGFIHYGKDMATLSQKLEMEKIKWQDSFRLLIKGKNWKPYGS